MLVTDMQEPPSLAQEAVIWCDGDEIVRWELEQREIVRATRHGPGHRCATSSSGGPKNVSTPTPPKQRSRCGE